MQATYEPFVADQDDPEETPHEFGAIIHVVPESGKSARWNHVDDLDSFFSRVYLYHQNHGFTTMILQKILELFQFVFVIVFSTFLFNGVDYQILFRNKENNQTINHRKISLNDAVIPFDECVANIPFLWWIVILVATVFLVIGVIRAVCHLFPYRNIKDFYNNALRIQDAELDNVTWHEVQKRIREVQSEQQMCIHKKELTELDIYHRILRYKNYLVAMVNKSLLPLHFRLPLLGTNLVYLTHGLKFNLNFLFFWGPWSPFQNSWHLREDYKKYNKRLELAQELSKQIVYLAFINLMLCPLILLWQILYAFYNYTETIKREPGALGSRCWSLYGRLYLRHFNELDHELHARLVRAYHPAAKYMSVFTSPTMTVIARTGAFVSGGMLAVLVCLTVYDEDVLTVEHMLTLMSFLSAVFMICKSFIPEENKVCAPEYHMTRVLAEVHYLPDTWRGNAHTTQVRNDFSQLFQYKGTYLLAEVLSPIITPFWLAFCLRPRAQEIVDFFRNFTVEVIGVGDVCSFAEMNVCRHGNPAWQTKVVQDQPKPTITGNKDNQAEDGKTELSLVHFSITNPEWHPPTKEAEKFVSAVRSQARNSGSHQLNINDNTLSSLGVGLSEMLVRPDMLPPSMSPIAAVPMHTSRMEGPIRPPQSSCHEMMSLTSSMVPESDNLPMISDMNLSTLYLHEIHYRQMVMRGYHEGNVWSRGPSTSRTQERTPLISRPS